jgi:hypothetical protein
VTGIRFALERGAGRSAVPVRSAIAGTIVAIVAVAAAVVFGWNMDRMLGEPAAFGWNWDLVAFGGEDPAIAREIERRLAASPDVAAFSRASIKTTSFRGEDVETLSIAPLEGTVVPTMIEGRFPSAAHEVALGSATMRSAAVGIGDRVSFIGSEAACVTDAECRVEFRVVGRLVFWGEGSDTDRGAGFTEEGQASVRTSEGFSDYLVRIPPRADPGATVRAIERAIGGDATLPSRPANISNLARARSMPTLLASILGMLALATVVHALITAARRRARDLAVLKTLGFERRQVRAVVAWQSTTTVAIALTLGIPLGVAVARWSWTTLADRLGVVAAPTTSAGLLAVGAAGVIVIANLVALVPARMAAHTHPAIVLRTE